jgi:chromosome partitioning protein
LKTPQIVSIVNQKGGCGKTTTAINALSWFSQKGLSTILIDTDEQSSSSRTIQELGLPFEQIFDATKLSKRLLSIREEYDHIIIDGPGGASEINRTIVNSSDLVIMPCKQFIYDVEGTQHTLAFLESAQAICRIPPVGVIFLNDVDERSAAFRQAQQFFSEESGNSFIFLKQFIPHQLIIGRMGVQGQSIFQIKGKVAQEMAERYDQLFKQALAAYGTKID